MVRIQSRTQLYGRRMNTWPTTPLNALCLMSTWQHSVQSVEMRYISTLYPSFSYVRNHISPGRVGERNYNVLSLSKTRLQKLVTSTCNFKISVIFYSRPSNSYHPSVLNYSKNHCLRPQSTRCTHLQSTQSPSPCLNRVAMYVCSMKCVLAFPLAATAVLRARGPR